MSYIPKNNLVRTGLVPKLDMSNYSQERLTEYINELKEGNNGTIYPFIYPKVDTNVTISGYFGGVYSPTQNRIYFIPRFSIVDDQTNWIYIDCNTGNTILYAHGLGQFTSGAFGDGVYSPTENKIYLVPYGTSDENTWYYIDCNNDNISNVVGYSHGITPSIIDGAYISGVYSPTENRIYFIPASIANTDTWHYVNCDTGTIVSYTHELGTGITQNAFIGGVYSPTEKKIYLVPHFESDETEWHYIDCSGVADSKLVVEYTHSLGVLPVDGAYWGGVYSPTQNRIYLVPYNQSSELKYHYINCDNGTVVEYNNIYAPNVGAYNNGVYSPVDNRIYFAPAGAAADINAIYINCDDGTLGNYTNVYASLTVISAGGVYSPTENKIYFIPKNLNRNNFYGIRFLSDRNPSRLLMANCMFNGM